ncbi:cytochrome c biogenesis CcdA family protein [Ferrigenium sp. UT4]
MELSVGSYGLALLAGLLTTLSPCVLPLLPILLGAATSEHRLGAIALAGGLMLSFATVGVALGALGGVVGWDAQGLRLVGGCLLLLFGAWLLSARVQTALTLGLGRIGIGPAMLEKFNPQGLWGQFLLGLLLGIVWTPCVGPTLGVAITIAGQGQALAQVAAVMGVFSLGAAIPLIALGLLSRQMLNRWRGHLQVAGRIARKFFGVALVVVGLAVVSGADKSFEHWVVRAMPDWLVLLTSRY